MKTRKSRQANQQEANLGLILSNFPDIGHKIVDKLHRRQDKGSLRLVSKSAKRVCDDTFDGLVWIHTDTWRTKVPLYQRLQACASSSLKDNVCTLTIGCSNWPIGPSELFILFENKRWGRLTSITIHLAVFSDTFSAQCLVEAIPDLHDLTLAENAPDPNWLKTVLLNKSWKNHTNLTFVHRVGLLLGLDVRRRQQAAMATLAECSRQLTSLTSLKVKHYGRDAYYPGGHEHHRFTNADEKLYGLIGNALAKAHFKNLTSLELASMVIPRTFPLLLGMSVVVESLILGGDSGIEDERAAVELRNALNKLSKTLETLELPVLVEGVAVHLFAGLSLPKLDTLSFNDYLGDEWSINAADMRAIATAKLPNISSLALHNAQFGSRALAALMSKKWEKLTSLHFASNSEILDGIVELHTDKLPALQRLDLSFSALTTPGVLRLISRPWPKLDEIHLVMRGLKGLYRKGLVEAFPVENTPKLKELDISCDDDDESEDDEEEEEDGNEEDRLVYAEGRYRRFADLTPREELRRIWMSKPECRGITLYL